MPVERCQLREGPYDDQWGYAIDEGEWPEHLRAYRCTGCDALHVDDEADGDYPENAARYSLTGFDTHPSCGRHAVYMHNSGDGCHGECLTAKAQRHQLANA
jgi:hypothetical protein